MSNTSKKEYERMRAAFELNFADQYDFSHTLCGGKYYDQEPTRHAWIGWRGSWRYTKDNGTNE